MFTINTHSRFHEQVFAHSLYELFHDCARDKNITCEMSDNTLSGFMFGLPNKVFHKMVQEWAWEKYCMYLRFVYGDDGAVKHVQIAWDQLDDDDNALVLLNMYPQDVAETQQQI